MRFPSDRLDPVQPAELWNPSTYQEWEAQERLRVFLAAWAAQADQERTLRGRCAWMIFSLAAFQSVCGAALLVALGRGSLSLDAEFLKILFSGILAEVFGLFFILVRFLFNQPLQFTASMLRDEARQVLDDARE